MALLSKLVVELGLKDGLGSGLDKSKKSVSDWAASLRKTGTMMTAAFTTPVVAGFAKMITGASDLAEAQSAATTVYGKGAAAIIKNAKGAAESVFLSQEAYLSAATSLGTFGKAAGLTGNDLAKFGDETIGAAADLASFYNTSTPEALEAIRAGLVGEFEPLRKYNIMLTAASVEQKALAMTGKTAADQLTEGEKVAARQALIMEGMGDAQGDAAKTAGGFANQMRQLQAQTANAAAELGTVLLPYALKFTKSLVKLSKWIQGLSTRQKKWVVILAGVAAAIGPILIAVSAMIPAISALGVAIGVLTGPIGLIVLALVGLGIAYKTNLFGFRDAVNATAAAVWNFLKPIIAFGAAMVEAFRSGKGVSDLVAQFPGPLQGAAKGFLLIADAVGDLIARWRSGGFGAMLDLLPAKLNQVKAALGILVREFFKFGTAIGNAIGDWIASVDWVSVLQTAGDLLIRGLRAGAEAAWPYIKTFFGNVPGWIRDALGALGKWLAPKGRALLRSLADGAEERWNALQKWFKGLPRKIEDAIGALGTLLAAKGRAVIRGLADGAEQRWAALKDWFRDLPNKIIAAVGTVLTGSRSLVSKGRDLLASLRDGAVAKWQDGESTVKGWFGRMGNRIRDAVGNVLSGTRSLVSKGEDLIIGLWDGAQAMWESADGVVGWLGGLGSDAAGYLGDAAAAAYNALWQAGFAFFKPVYDGMQWVWDNWIQPLIDKIPGWVPGFGGSSESVAASASARMAQAGLATRSAGGFAVRNTAGLASAAGAGTRVVNIQAGAIQVNGVTDPDLVATHVVNRINRELRLA